MIGGGDWARDRIVPDCVRPSRPDARSSCATPRPSARGSTCSSRSPATCCSARLLPGEGSECRGRLELRACAGRRPSASSWVVERFIEEWGEGAWRADAGRHDGSPTRRTTWRSTAPRRKVAWAGRRSGTLSRPSAARRRGTTSTCRIASRARELVEGDLTCVHRRSAGRGRLERGFRSERVAAARSCARRSSISWPSICAEPARRQAVRPRRATRVRYAGRVFGAEELHIPRRLQPRLLAHRRPVHRGVRSRVRRATWACRHALLVNSGSSANLRRVHGAHLAQARRARRLQPGDEVITVAAGFPTTVTPIVQNGAVPVFVDVRLSDYNVDVRMRSRLRSAERPGRSCSRTRSAIRSTSTRSWTWLRSTTCGSSRTTATRSARGIDGQAHRDLRPPRARRRFYPAHHITMGEGGAVVTDDEELARDRASLPRLGPGLLLRRRRGQHLRQALLPAVRHAALRLRPQVRLHRISATTSR